MLWGNEAIVSAFLFHIDKICAILYVSFFIRRVQICTEDLGMETA